MLGNHPCDEAEQKRQAQLFHRQALAFIRAVPSISASALPLATSYTMMGKNRGFRGQSRHVPECHPGRFRWRFTPPADR